MAVWDTKILWSFMFMLAGAVGQRVDYPGPVCAVKGSTVTVLCSFTPPPSTTVIRVVWCQNHMICQGVTPSVYDSESKNNDPRYKYLGDKKTNCTLQISDVREEDGETLRFRMETNDTSRSYTGIRPGVKLTVEESTELKINSSAGDRQVRGGETVTLSCTARCTIHRLEVNWFRDGHALPESGPALQLRSLTAGDSGNYTCGLKSGGRSRSPPYSLHVEEEEEEEGRVHSLPVDRLVFFSLHTVLIVVVTSIIIRRTCCHGDRRKLKEETLQPPDSVTELRRPEERGGSSEVINCNVPLYRNL